jgi:hypothetical protein
MSITSPAATAAITPNIPATVQVSNTPLPAVGIVPGNHNFVVYFYQRDAFTGQIRISEEYTTPKTYSARTNSKKEALEKCQQWAERKVEEKNHFMRGYRIEELVTAVLVDAAPEGVTFAEASRRPITTRQRRTPEAAAASPAVPQECPYRGPRVYHHGGYRPQRPRTYMNIDNC